MIDIEKLAIECGANTRLAETMFRFTPKQLNNFAKAYLNEWLKEQEVVANTALFGDGDLELIWEEDYLDPDYVELHGGYEITKLIAIPSEVK